jgi:leader peptidase (prepilin peptidase)/N-methyltransferase
MGASIEALLAFILGCVVGSFLNVVRHRLPKGVSVARGRSRCPACGRTIAWYDNIPVLSFLLLKRRCRWCGWRIPWTYLVIELATGASFLLVWFEFGWPRMIGFSVFTCLLIACAGIDYDLRIIPDRLTLPGVALGVLFSVTLLREGPVDQALWRSVLGMLVGGGSLYVFSALYKLIRGVEGMGGGDVKLMAMVGAFLGFRLSLLTIFLASVIGGIVGVAVMRKSGRGMKTAVPFGVFLSPAAIVSMLWGNDLIHLYLRLL